MHTACSASLLTLRASTFLFFFSQDRSFTFILKTSPTSVLLKKAAGETGGDLACMHTRMHMLSGVGTPTGIGGQLPLRVRIDRLACSSCSLALTHPLPTPMHPDRH